MPEADPLRTVAQFCDELQIRKTKGYDLIRKGEIKSLKIGTARRIPASAIQDFIRRQLAAAE